MAVVSLVLHALAYVKGDRIYGSKATINVWRLKIQQPNELSLSQIWILDGVFSLDNIETGWQVIVSFKLSHEMNEKL
ncbi:DUF239 domain protein [Medicago truncatula]|uniref:DUF239 domain protein n=1 Tax=Medicago truncatula TaxID=3880 RepID=G7KBI6_MEDTR|nr:DUF239 domain protein [Medicago truncatula]